MENTIVVARPLATDVEGVQDVFHRTWLDTYPNIEFGVTKDVINEWFNDNAFTKEKIKQRRQLFANPTSDNVFLVAKQGDKVVGVCRPEKHKDKNVVRAFYVLPEFQGRGVGRQLWGQMLNHFDQSKDTYVDVVVYNKKAIGFYKHLGFVETGKQREDLRVAFSNGARFHELEMARKAT